LATRGQRYLTPSVQPLTTGHGRNTEDKQNLVFLAQIHVDGADGNLPEEKAKRSNAYIIVPKTGQYL
jgi:hypothetical protein